MSARAWASWRSDAASTSTASRAASTHLPGGDQQRAHAEGLADRLGRAEAPRDLEFLLDELARALVLAQAGACERRVAAPHQRTRVDVEERLRAGTCLL